MMRNVNQILIGKPEGRRPLESPRDKCEFNNLSRRTVLFGGSF
jgi:hypothetical protein